MHLSHYSFSSCCLPLYVSLLFHDLNFWRMVVRKFIEYLSTWICLIFSHDSVGLWIWGENTREVTCSPHKIMWDCYQCDLLLIILDLFVWSRWYLSGFSTVKLLFFPFQILLVRSQSLSPAYLKGNGIKLLFPEGRVSEKMVKASVVINNNSEEILRVHVNTLLLLRAFLPGLSIYLQVLLAGTTMQLF